ncbi:MAG: nickel pincer cofactor biosynthesis protein LarC [Desulfobacterales bacterium]|jgi:uncharacterized protein (TIGR00299 family) protein
MARKHLHFDCLSGISGDMTLAALIDLGAPPERLREDLARLQLGAFDLTVETVSVNGIAARQVNIDLPREDNERHFSDIRAMIDRSGLPDRVKSRAVDTFRRLAGAEAEVHGCSPEEVHFHEVGAADAIIDIVGTALCLDYLEIERVSASPLPLGSGFVTCRHGVLPLPAPATLALLKDVPVKGTAIEGELVTPTGAAIITSLAENFGPLPAMNLLATGHGAGRQRFDERPNLLRVVMGHTDAGDAIGAIVEDDVELIETAIDDLNPEVYGHLMERLLAAGALDVSWIPAYMKKNRPGTLVRVLCRSENVQAAANIIFTETTSLGLRVQPVRRLVLPREEVVVETSLGPVRVKRCRTPDGGQRLSPEYEECRRLAKTLQRPLRDVYDLIRREIGPLRPQGDRAAGKRDTAIDKKGR